MSGFFSTARGGFSLYLDEAEAANGPRFALARFGEDPGKVLAEFYRENPLSDFPVVPLFAYGQAPRPELCTQRSLTQALQSVDIEPGSRTEQQWKAVAEHHSVAWPIRLRPKAA